MHKKHNYYVKKLSEIQKMYGLNKNEKKRETLLQGGMNIVKMLLIIRESGMIG